MRRVQVEDANGVENAITDEKKRKKKKKKKKKKKQDRQKNRGCIPHYICSFHTVRRMLVYNPETA